MHLRPWFWITSIPTTACILLVVLALLGVWPFGRSVVVDLDKANIAKPTPVPDMLSLPTTSPEQAVRVLNQQLLVGAPSWSVAWSPDGKMLAAGFGGYGGGDSSIPLPEDYVVRLWNTDHFDQAPITLKGHKHLVTSVAFSPDGNWLAAGTRGAGLFPQYLVFLWNLKQPESQPIVLKDPTSSVQDVAFSPDGRQVAAAIGDGTVRVWSIAQSK